MAYRDGARALLQIAFAFVLPLIAGFSNATTIQQDIDDNPKLAAAGIAAEVIGQKNGYITVAITKGSDKLIKGLLEGADLGEIAFFRAGSARHLIEMEQILKERPDVKAVLWVVSNEIKKRIEVEEAERRRQAYLNQLNIESQQRARAQQLAAEREARAKEARVRAEAARVAAAEREKNRQQWLVKLEQVDPKETEPKPPVKKFTKGDNVLVKEKDGWWYPGAVERVQPYNKFYDVRDYGIYVRQYRAEDVIADDITIGDRVFIPEPGTFLLGRPGRLDKFQPAIVIGREGGSLTVRGPSMQDQQISIRFIRVGRGQASTMETTPKYSPQRSLSHVGKYSWTGQWRGNGYIYDAVLELLVEPSGSVDGRINWTQRSSPTGQAKVGLVAIEFVRGAVKGDGRTIELRGYRKDDPRNVIGLDHYSLSMAHDWSSFSGKTRGHGGWDSQIVGIGGSTEKASSSRTNGNQSAKFALSADGWGECGSSWRQKIAIPEYNCFGYGGVVPFVWCAPAVLVGYKPVYFGVACQQHDRCYGRTGAIKSECDKEFLDNITAACTGTLTGKFRSTSLELCKKTASVYFSAVSAKGCAPFKSAQSNLGVSEPDCR